MKKTTKGALAAGAAAVLLAGGAGTYAAWTSTAPSISAGSVSTGELRVTQTKAPSWTWVTGGTVGEAVPADAKLVPGDSIKYEGTYKLDIVGTNLTAKLDIETTGATTDLQELEWTPSAGNTSLTGLNQTKDNGKTVTVGGTLSFPGTATATMDKTFNLGDVAITLKQTAPATAP